MIFIKLVINELEKIFKKKAVYVFIIFAFMCIIISSILLCNKKENILSSEEYSPYSKDAILFSISDMEIRLLHGDELTKYEKDVLKKDIEIYYTLIDKGPQKIFTASYKGNVLNELVNCYHILISLDEIKNAEEYKLQENNIQRAWNLLESGTFEQYIEFSKDLISQKYNRNEITKEEYHKQISQMDEYLKYEIGKYSDLDANVKISILSARANRIESINTRIFTYGDEKKYLNDEDIKKEKKQVLIDTYRLENNILPYYDDWNPKVNLDSYIRYKYNELANISSIICIGILMIILSASAISDEISKGTIKFALIMPYSRSKLLFAKLVSLLIISIVLIFLVSQISIMVGNIAFGINTNNYLYVKDGSVQIMNTYLYELIQYLLRIPEIIIYIIVGITLSVLIKNTTISSIVTSVSFIGVPVAIDMITKNIIVLDFLKYLPFNNFDFIDKILILEKYITSIEITLPKMELEYSIISLIFIATLLLITAFDSLRKKEI